MMSAQIAWELARNTGGRFRLGLGSQVKAHIERRYASTWDRPAPQRRDYLAAVKAALRAFRGEQPLQHEGPYYTLNLLPAAWAPARHDFENVKVDISAVGPHMCRVAGELADGVHVHPMHSMTYVQNRLVPALRQGAEVAGRTLDDLEMIFPVFAVPGDSREEQALLLERARTQIGFYGSTPNYAYQFTDLGFEGVSEGLRECMRSGKMERIAELVSDEILSHFAVTARWDDMADALLARYQPYGDRLVMYLAQEDIARRPANLGRWGEIARAVQAA
jgi:probable F420-dependent oxidoreductase